MSHHAPQHPFMARDGAALPHPSPNPSPHGHAKAERNLNAKMVKWGQSLPFLRAQDGEMPHRRSYEAGWLLVASGDFLGSLFDPYFFWGGGLRAERSRRLRLGSPNRTFRSAALPRISSSGHNSFPSRNAKGERLQRNSIQEEFREAPPRKAPRDPRWYFRVGAEIPDGFPPRRCFQSGGWVGNGIPEDFLPRRNQIPSTWPKQETFPKPR